jgi:hypothetical protein
VLRAYCFALENDPALTNLAEVVDAIRGLKVGNEPVPIVIPTTALQQLPQSVVPFLVKVMYTIFRMQYFWPAWKHAYMFY